ncbi:deubiquitinase OTUD6B [Athalia rosae]|uniref:deubiquitinase OTUD6B n=1 Tax=Athalia rosae TaxID=37344 RepID=UPI0020341131|nr:deubiquitinase OTUD6B [Athalia rosae]
MAEGNNCEELSLRHKKERKELQAQIQNLKKSVCKGDKKRKKEITEEIVQLESDLDQRQEQELLDWIKLVNLDDRQKNEIPCTSEELAGECSHACDPIPRVSKAQKRRNKKQDAENERNQRIIQQEAENVFGKRNIETQAIRRILKERSLQLHEIPSDGHCLYNAVSHQLEEIGEMPLGFKDLRIKTSEHLKANMNDFVPFLSSADSDGIFSTEEYEKYCLNVAESTAWGGAVELQVLSRVLKCPIEVIQATGSPYVIGDEYRDKGKTVILTYHRHMYGLGAHYNSVKKFTVKDEES